MLDNLNPQTRKMLLAVALILVGGVAVLQWGIIPLKEKRERAEAALERSRDYLREITVLGDQYARQKKALERMGTVVLQRPERFTLFAFVESLAAREGLRKHIVFMRPAQRVLSEERTEELVEMRLTGVSLDVLVPYLFHIESAPEQVRVKRLTIRGQQREQNLLDVDLVLSAMS
jgi:type II secretory pathway component PulM